MVQVHQGPFKEVGEYATMNAIEQKRLLINYMRDGSWEDLMKLVAYCDPTELKTMGFNLFPGEQYDYHLSNSTLLVLVDLMSATDYTEEWIALIPKWVARRIIRGQELSKGNTSLTPKKRRQFIQQLRRRLKNGD